MNVMTWPKLEANPSATVEVGRTIHDTPPPFLRYGVDMATPDDERTIELRGTPAEDAS